MEAFHAAYRRGRMVNPPQDYLDLILIPAVLHVDPLEFSSYPPVVAEKVRVLVRYFLASGQGLRPQVGVE